MSVCCRCFLWLHGIVFTRKEFLNRDHVEQWLNLSKSSSRNVFLHLNTDRTRSHLTRMCISIQIEVILTCRFKATIYRLIKFPLVAVPVVFMKAVNGEQMALLFYSCNSGERTPLVTWQMVQISRYDSEFPFDCLNAALLLRYSSSIKFHIQLFC